MEIKIISTVWSLKQIVKWFSEAEEYEQICWMAKQTLTKPVKNAWPENRGRAIIKIKTHNRGSMKNDLLNALLMISIIGPACNTTAANTLIIQAGVEFQDKKPQKKTYSFQSAIKSKSMSSQVSTNEEVPDLLLLLERES